jgi:hypothetical protein
MICHGDTSDKSIDTWETGLEIHEDDDSIFSSFNSKFDNRYQVLAIVGDNSEEFDENNNPVVMGMTSGVRQGRRCMSAGVPGVSTASSIKTGSS